MLAIQRRTIGNIQCRENNISIGINETDLGKTAYNHLAINIFFAITLYERNGTQLIKLDSAVIFSYDRRIGCGISGHTTSVERTKRKLGTRLSNGLSCNDTDSLTHLNHPTRSEITSVTFHTNPVFAFTGEYGTNFNTLNR